MGVELSFGEDHRVFQCCVPLSGAHEDSREWLQLVTGMHDDEDALIL